MIRLDREAGLTLVEVLVALVILGLMAGVVLEATRLGGAIWTRAERTSGATDDMDTLHRFLRRMIENTYPAFASADPADRRVLFEGRPDSLLLVTPLPGLVPDGTWAVASLALTGPTVGGSPPAGASGAGLSSAGLSSASLSSAGASSNPPLPPRALASTEPALTLTWRLDLPGSDGQPLPLQSDRLLPRAASLRFTFFGSTEPGAPPGWTDHWVGRDRLPSLVRIVLERDGVAWPEIVVAPRVTASTARVYDAAAPAPLRFP